MNGELAIISSIIALALAWYIAWIFIRKHKSRQKRGLVVHLTVDASIIGDDNTFLEIESANNEFRNITKEFTAQITTRSDHNDGVSYPLDLEVQDAAAECPGDIEIKNCIIQTLDLETKILRHADDSALLAKIVASDPVLGADVLRIANSTYYRTAKEIKSLKYAIEKIGVAALRAIVVNNIMGKPTSDATFNIDTYKSVARHSAYCAICASYFGSLFPQLDKSVLYTAGLLHDIGKIIVLSSLVNENRQCLRPYASHRKIDNDALLWKCDHAHFGASYLSKWKFDGLLVSLVKAHHYPSLCDHMDHATDEKFKKYLFILYLANQFAKCISPESKRYVERLSYGFHPLLQIGSINNLVEKTNIFNDLFKINRLLNI